ncbi:hypothetical protein KHA80_12110 [Anaerobacillus sp. HL2]|nr:hypothetical protein KHA80_12110 [Anaerobacillus sp. HL2]
MKDKEMGKVDQEREILRRRLKERRLFFNNMTYQDLADKTGIVNPLCSGMKQGD